MIKNRTALRTRTAFLTKQKTKEIAVLPRRPLIFPRPFPRRAITKIPESEPTVSVVPSREKGRTGTLISSMTAKRTKSKAGQDHPSHDHEDPGKLHQLYVIDFALHGIGLPHQSRNCDEKKIRKHHNPESRGVKN